MHCKPLMICTINLSPLTACLLPAMCEKMPWQPATYHTSLLSCTRKSLLMKGRGISLSASEKKEALTILGKQISEAVGDVQLGEQVGSRCPPSYTHAAYIRGSADPRLSPPGSMMSSLTDIKSLPPSLPAAWTRTIFHWKVDVQNLRLFLPQPSPGRQPSPGYMSLNSNPALCTRRTHQMLESVPNGEVLTNESDSPIDGPPSRPIIASPLEYKSTPA